MNFLEFKDLAGLGVFGTIIIGLFVLLGAMPVSMLVCVMILTGLAIKFGRA
jgi:hypothetical protein